MEGFKEFQGKDLDDAIEEACGYFNTAREKLEIEIVQDAKSGIFGIVGARKAKVRARRVQLREAVENILGRKGGDAVAAPAPSAAPEARAEAPDPQAKGPEASGSKPRNGNPDGVKAGQAEPAMEAASAAPTAASPAAPTTPEDKARPEARERRQEDRAPRGQQDDRRGRGRGNRRGQPQEAQQAAEGNHAAPSGEDADGNVAERPADRRAERNGRPERNGNKPQGRGRNDRGRDRNGRAPDGAEGVEAADAADAPRREPRGRRNESRPENRGEGRGDARAPREASRPDRPAKNDAPPDGMEDDFEEVGEGLPVTPLEQLDAARLETLVDDTVRKLIRPITGETAGIVVKIGGGRVQVSIDCDEDSGLLIGREGQTLAALQYMVSRIVSRGMNAAVRVQLDAGEYRRRQDEKLREMALALAEKVRQSGRSYSTRPLSSYHRRIVHVCLQEALDVQTRSTGDGPMKRVVIMRKKGERPQ